MRVWLSNLVLIGLSFSVWSAVSPGILDTGAHCVAYRVTKTSFLISKSAVVGKNCDVSAQVLPEVGGLYHIEVNVPIRGFNSGDQERDADVMKILRINERADLTFKTKPMKAEDWRGLFEQPVFEIDGELSIGTREYPVKLTLRYRESEREAEVDGFGKVTFKDLGLKPPAVAGGFLVKAKEDIELHFRLQGRRILGADSIRLEKENK